MTRDDETFSDPSEAGGFPGGRPGLTPRQSDVAQELQHLHPDLESLYVRGVKLLPEVNESGVPLLVAHIGRELARGVQNLLLEEEDYELPEAEAESIPEDAEHRASIAESLQLPPNDPRVSKWLQVYNDLTGWAHFRITSPDGDEVRQAFEDLETILHGRVGPYFATQAELDEFLALDGPSLEDVERLQPYLLRPAQRRYFFQELENPAWVPHFLEAGTFDDPPEWIGDEDEGWQARPWPEGGYLARVAGEVPDAVVQIIEGVSPELKNPTVWDALTTAATRIPPARASEVVSKFCKALQLPTATVFFSDDLADLVRLLASDGQEEAFDLASALLFVPSSTDLEEREGRLPSGGRWLLPRIDWTAGETLFDTAVPSLEVADNLRTLELLLSTLNQIVAVLRALDLERRFWRPDRFDIDGEAERPDSPERLFLEAVRVMRNTASRDRESAERALELVEEMSEDVGERLRYVLLAEAGRFLSEEVDALLTSESTIRPGGPAREVALFLREQFEQASPVARRMFRYSLEQGPTVEEVKHHFAFAEVDEPDEEDFADARRNWQRKRILWFRDQVPDELEHIAESVGVTADELPSTRDRELAEVGFYSAAGGGWVGPQSPVDDDELADMAPREIVQLLGENGTDGDAEGEFDLYGLSDSLGRLATSDADKVIQSANLAVEAGLGVQELRAFADAIREAVDESQPFTWAEALRFASAAVESAVGRENSEVAELVAALAMLINSGFSEDAIPPGDFDATWDLLETLVQVEAVWEEEGRETLEGFQGVLTLALNHPAGKLARATLSGVLRVFRALAPDGVDLTAPAEEAREVIADEALPVLELLLQHEGQGGVAVEAIFGRYLPQLHHLAPEWLEARAERLLRPGCENPLEHPAWPSYLWHWGFVRAVFERYRSYYLLTAEAADRLSDDEGEESGRSVADQLASHLLMAVLQDAVSVGDEDELLETAFANLPPSTRSHAYWGVYNAWSDTEDEPPQEFRDRLLRFWRWRVEQLEGEATKENREEARGLAWLIHAPYLPDAEVAELGARTVELANGEVRINTLWDRLTDLGQVAPNATADMVHRAIDAELESEHPLVSAEEGIPAIRELLNEVDEERRRSLLRMVHRLGDAGFDEFGELVENA